MGKEIWNVLANYGGRWVAMDNAGEVAADAETLPELMQAARGSPRRLTLLYAATETAVRS
jgi:hypothetical protein